METGDRRRGVDHHAGPYCAAPDYQQFCRELAAAPPATIARELLETLLRQELGFTGLIVSDATGMMGFASPCPAGEVAVAINAGIDLYLGANPDRDHPALLAAVRDGRVPEERIRTATQRALTLKARLMLMDDPFGPAPTDIESAEFAHAAQAMADKSITLVHAGAVPAGAARGRQRAHGDHHATQSCDSPTPISPPSTRNCERGFDVTICSTQAVMSCVPKRKSRLTWCSSMCT
ncbi:MAG: glycoside hydrolase family 3 N-terminal domain-containing protein [Caldilineaceae bacterium]